MILPLSTYEVLSGVRPRELETHWNIARDLVMFVLDGFSSFSYFLSAFSALGLLTVTCFLIVFLPVVPFVLKKTMAGGRPKGTKNKAGHKGGGARRGENYRLQKERERQRKVDEALARKQFWSDKVQGYRSGTNVGGKKKTVPHPLSKNLRDQSQRLMLEVLNHPSMPKAEGAVPICGFIDESTYDVEYEDDEEDNESECYRRSYLPPKGTPMHNMMEDIKKKTLEDDVLKQQKIILPTMVKASRYCVPLARGLSNPTPEIFCRDVTVRNWNPMTQYPGIIIEYGCPYCGEKNLRKKGWRWRPAFAMGDIQMVLHERFQCQNHECKGNGRGKYFTTIDNAFISKLPTAIAAEFEFIFPARGPGILLDMIRQMSINTDKHVLFGAFAKQVNQLQWQRYYRQSNQYYDLLDNWLGQWPALEEFDGSPPLHALYYDGRPIEPYPAFGSPGYHNGILLNEEMVKEFFFILEGDKRLRYMSNSFAAWHDDGLSMDDTHKITKRVYINTSGRSRARPYTALQTVLAKSKKIVAAAFKFTKSHAEALAVAKKLKTCRDFVEAPPLKVLWTDDPKGEEGPMREVFGEELLLGTTPFEKVGSLPKIDLKLSEIDYFDNVTAANNFFSSDIFQNKLKKSELLYGLDTEFEKDGKELTALGLSFYGTEPMNEIVLNLHKMKQIPDSLKAILSSKERIACGRNIGIDCQLLFDQYKILVPLRIEARTICIRDKPELESQKGATGLDNLLEVYYGVRYPFDKSEAQNKSYKKNKFTEEDIIYIGLDALVSRLVVKRSKSNLEAGRVHDGPAVFGKGSTCTVTFYNRPVATGELIFFGLEGEQRKWGDTTLGKQHCLVLIDKIIDPNHKPRKRLVDSIVPGKSWPEDAKTLHELWSMVDGLTIAVNLNQISINVSRREDSEPLLTDSWMTRLDLLRNDDDVEMTDADDENIEITEMIRQHTRSLRDIFHELHNLPIKKKSVIIGTAYQLSLAATWINNDLDYSNVVEVLQAKNVDIETHELYNHEYWHKRVRRGTPAPQKHASNIRSVKKYIENDSNFAEYLKENPKLLEWFDKFAQNAEQGMYQLPNDLQLYRCIGTDSDGLNLYASDLGTNLNELVHKLLADLLGPYGVGVKTAHVLVILRCFRYNISVGISRGLEPDFGTDRHDMVDLTQHWIMKIFGILAWPNHRNLLDFDPPKDCALVGIVPLHHDDEDIQTCDEISPDLSKDYTFYCKSMNAYGPLPCSTYEEFKIFSQEMYKIAAFNKTPSLNDWKRIARLYQAQSNYKVIFPKTVEMLKKQYARWKQLQHVKLFQNAVKDGASAVLRKLKAQRVQTPPTVDQSLPKTVGASKDITDLKSIVPPDSAPKQPTYEKLLTKKDRTKETKGASSTSSDSACAWYPFCKYPQRVCRGKRKESCVFLSPTASKNSHIRWVPGSGDVMVLQLKSPEAEEVMTKAKTARQNRRRQFQREIQKLKKLQNNNVEAALPCFLGEEAIVFKGRGSKNWITITRMDTFDMTTSGRMINDNIVSAYLNLLTLTDKGEDLRVVSTTFLIKLQLDGWGGVCRWLRETETLEGNWDTAPLIFIPGFFGDPSSGHWAAIIIQQTRRERNVFFIDSWEAMRQRNFDFVKRLLDCSDTPFHKANFWLLNSPVQAAGSNDCGPCMLGAFTAWLKYYSNSNERVAGTRGIELEGMTATAYGVGMRQFIFNSLQQGEASLEANVIGAFKFVQT